MSRGPARVCGSRSACRLIGEQALFRRRRSLHQVSQRSPALRPFPGPDHLRTSFRVTFPDGRSFEYFVLPAWSTATPFAFMDKVVQYVPQPGLENVALQNAAASYLKFALGCTDGIKTTDGDHEVPVLGMVVDYEVLEAAGIDLNDWILRECEWEPKVFRDNRLGHKRVKDVFGLDEELRCSKHGVLREGLWQTTYHLTDKALYVFGESHEDSCARFPLQLFVQQTKNPAGAFGPGNFQMFFMDPGDFDFGVLPSHAPRGELTIDGVEQDVTVIAVEGFQVAEVDGWEPLGRALAKTLPGVLPTERCEVTVGDVTVGCLFSKTIVGRISFCFESDDISRSLAEEVRASDEFRAGLNRAYENLPLPSLPTDDGPAPANVGRPDQVAGEAIPNVRVRERLERLSRLEADGIISASEHDEQRRRILGEL